MKILSLDKSFILFLLIIAFCGLFNNFVSYFLLLIIHESGHMLAGICLGLKLDKIKIYPYGGVTLFKSNYNLSLIKELIILLMGPLMQILGYLVLKNFIHYDYLKLYHYSLLFFNLLPIYPLDGGKLLNIIFNYYLNYKKSFSFSYYSSLILISLLFIYNIYYFNLNLLFILIILLMKLIKNHRNLNYSYNAFLLERYLNNYSFKKIKCINSMGNFYRDREHIVKIQSERNALKKYFHH